jgi:hypothetical protein
LRGLKIGANYGVRTLDPVAPQFEAGELKARSIVSTAPSCVLIHGDHTAVDPEAQAMLQRLGIQLSNGGHAAAALLAETIQFIADKRGGTTISPNCWTHSVSRQNPFSPIGKHFRDPQLQTPQPLLISPGGLIQGTISQELPGYEAALDRLKRGLTTDKLVGAMLAAYLDWSPTIAELCAEFERQCVDVGSDSKMPYVPDYLSLFEFSGYTTPYTLERHLESANPWLSELAAEYAKVAGAEPSKRAGIQRRRAVALLLAALNPQKYPTERPRSSLPPLDDLSFMPWPIDEQTLSLVREFHRRRSGGHP